MDLCACDVLARQQANKSIGRLRSSCPTHMSRAHAAKLQVHTAKRDGSANDVWGTLSSGGRYDALVKNKQMPGDVLARQTGHLFVFQTAYELRSSRPTRNQQGNGNIFLFTDNILSNHGNIFPSTLENGCSTCYNMFTGKSMLLQK